MNRETAFQLVKLKLKNKNLVKHVLAVEAVMIALAEKLGEDAQKWGLCGLLHDLDYEETVDNPERHSLLTAEFLKDEDVEEDIIYSIKCHCDKVPRVSLMDKAIYAADPVTGFIVACALMHPEKKLAPLDLEFMKRRFKEKRFAAGADRTQIASCSELGLSLDEFLMLSLNAMQKINRELGL
ncbi:HDIG domain-containing protein [candidate division KSB1 bacterium]|nr:HDIG domain-containing protein [candidate division KSB1 bacterium]